MNNYAVTSSHAITLSIRVGLDDYVDAAYARRRGNLTANPLSQAMGSQTYFALTSYKRGAFRVVDRRSAVVIAEVGVADLGRGEHGHRGNYGAMAAGELAIVPHAPAASRATSWASTAPSSRC